MDSDMQKIEVGTVITFDGEQYRAVAAPRACRCTGCCFISKKPWPQSGDIYFYVASDCTIVSDNFYGTSLIDKGRFDCGNFFRTKEEAVAAEKVKALFKELVAK